MQENYGEDHIIGGRAEDLAQIAKSEKKADGAGAQLMKNKLLGTLVVDRVTVHSVSKLDTISTAFEALWSTAKRSYTHFIDIVDIVAYVVAQLGHPEQGLPITQLPAITKLPDFTANAVDWAVAHAKVPYEPMDDKATVLHALEWMRKSGAARIAVIDNAGELQTIVTESGILKFLHANLSNFPQRTSTLEQLSLSTSKFCSIQNNARAIEAFRLVAKNRAGAIAVLNERHEIVGNISATDLRVINQTGGYAAMLFLPANLFIRLRDEPASVVSLPVVASPTSTLEEVITKLVTFKIHQIYVTKGASGQAGEVCGVVDLRSILQVLRILP